MSLNSYAENPPAIDYEHIMDGYFDDTSGLISFTDYRIAFAPEPPFNGFVAVLDVEGNIVGKHEFYPDYVNREGIFATIRAKNPADVTVTKPGLYTIVFVANNIPITRFLVRLEQTSAGEDAFDPEKKYRFDGYWRTMAHLTISSWKDEPFPQLTMWVGGKDLTADAKKDYFIAALLKEGEVLAHSKVQLHDINQGPLRAKICKPVSPTYRKRKSQCQAIFT